MPQKEDPKSIQLPPELLSYIISFHLADELFVVANYNRNNRKSYYEAAKAIATASTHLFGFVSDKVQGHLGVIGQRVDALRQLRSNHKKVCSIKMRCGLCKKANMLVRSEEVLYNEVDQTSGILKSEWRKMKHLYGVKEMTLWVV